MLDLLLNKGGAGYSLGRFETAERLNTLIEQLTELAGLYAHSDAADVQAQQSALRLDVARLKETVLSLGAIPYNGVARPPEALPREDLDGLRRKESLFADALADQLKLDHQIRTKAVLVNVQRNAQARLETLDEILRHRRP